MEEKMNTSENTRFPQKYANGHNIAALKALVTIIKTVFNLWVASQPFPLTNKGLRASHFNTEQSSKLINFSSSIYLNDTNLRALYHHYEKTSKRYNGDKCGLCTGNIQEVYTLLDYKWRRLQSNRESVTGTITT
uniref:Uncharacterized protein n=1 Tax=Glossina pallidipes TaxID=7398 RepID=A0A1A9ZGD2_GLOPL